MKYWHAPGGTEWGIKIGLVPTGFRPWELGFLCSPTPTGVGERFTLGGEGDSIAHQGAYLSYTYHPPCNRGVKGGGALHVGEKTELRKAGVIKAGNQSVQGVQGRFHLFLHFLLSDFFAKNVRNGYMYPAHPAQAPWENISRCGKRCFLPCKRYTKGEGRQSRPARGEMRRPRIKNDQTVYPLSGHGCYSDWLVPSPKGRSDLSSNSSVPKGSLLMSLDGL